MSSGLVEDDPWADRLLDMDVPSFRALLAGGLAFDIPPATAYEYSNLGYAILGEVIANVTGMKLRDFAQERLFDPLGMTQTTWDMDHVSPDNLAGGYRLENGDWKPETPLPDGAFGAMGWPCHIHQRPEPLRCVASLGLAGAQRRRRRASPPFDTARDGLTAPSWPHVLLGRQPLRR